MQTFNIIAQTFNEGPEEILNKQINANEIEINIDKNKVSIYIDGVLVKSSEFLIDGIIKINL